MRYLANYHSHTIRCQHARGTEEEYIQAALRNGFRSVGFTDHGCWPFKTGFVSGMRMRVDELKDYTDTVKALREKYAGQIRIHLGMEYESFPEFFPWLREIKAEYGFEYFILGNHQEKNEELGIRYFGDCTEPEHLEHYLRYTVEGMESGLFAYLAHPDLCLFRYPRFDDTAERVCRELCRAGKRAGMPMEFNLLGHSRQAECREAGTLGYCSPEFWQIAAEEGCEAVIGVDAHWPEMYDCVPKIEAARAYLEGLGIRVLDKLDFLDGEE